MSYNITDWKVKKLENLQIPIKAFFKHERKDKRPGITMELDGVINLECGCEQDINGHMVASGS